MHPAVSRRRPLAAGVGAAFALAIAASSVCAAPAVTSCDDDGSPGTLRYAVLTANEKDSLDLSQLQCTTITLQTGAINVDQNDLTITGPGAQKLTVDAGGSSRVFYHSGTGRLRFYAMTIANGHVSADRALGGCISSAGSVGITHSVVTGCSATATTTAGGGGIFAVDDVFLGSSVVSGNTAESSAAAGASGYAFGGGAASAGSLRVYSSHLDGNHAHINYGFAFGGGGYSAGSFTAKYSTIDGNLADVTLFNNMGSFGGGGGIAFSREANGTDFSMRYSTVSHNHADTSGGFFAGGTSAEIYNSTVSGNIANLGAGGALVGSSMKLFNSTIAFNTGGSYGGGGLLAQGSTLKISSTIIADNSPGGQFAADFDCSATITGDHNLIRFAGGTGTLPIDTLRVDPMLGALRDNGGLTHTHALLVGSPAIDKGSNSKNLLNDQRRFGFDRAVGTTDIGAYEYDPDIIFVSGLE